jgi:hypothetical protein
MTTSATGGIPADESTTQNSTSVTPSDQRTASIRTSLPAQFSPISNQRSNLSQVEQLSDAELQTMASVFLQTMRSCGLSLPSLPIIMPPKSDIYDNARFEQIACAGLSQKYDGTLDPLIPTLNLIHLRRQNEVWYEATFMSANGVTVDLVHQFSKASLTTVKDQAKRLWSLLNASVQRHTRGTRLYNSQLFGLFLLIAYTRFCSAPS